MRTPWPIQSQNIQADIKNDDIRTYDTNQISPISIIYSQLNDVMSKKRYFLPLDVTILKNDERYFLVKFMKLINKFAKGL